MKFINRFRTLEDAKKYALDNIRNKQIYVIITDKISYDVCCAYTDDDIPMIIEKLHMQHYNKYVVGFAYYYNGWDSDYKLFIDIKY